MDKPAAHQTKPKTITKDKKLFDEVQELVKKKQMILDGKIPDDSPITIGNENGTIVITLDTTKAKKAKKKKRTPAEIIVEILYLNYRNSHLSDIITFEEFCDPDKKRAAEAKYFAKLLGYEPYPLEKYTKQLLDEHKFYTDYSISNLFNPFPADRLEVIRSSLDPFEKLEPIISSLYPLEKYAKQLIEEREKRINTFISHFFHKLTIEEKIEAIKHTGEMIIQIMDELEHEMVKALCYNIGSNLANIDYHTSDRYHQNRYQRAKAFIALVENLKFDWIDQDDDGAYYYEDILHAVRNYLHIFDKIFNILKRVEEIKTLDTIKYIQSNPNLEYDQMLILLKEQIIANNRLIKIEGHKIVIHVVAQMLGIVEEKLRELFTYLLHTNNKTTRYKFKKQISKDDHNKLPQDLLELLLS